MPAPLAYTELTLLGYMASTIQGIATDLGWTSGSSTPSDTNYLGDYAKPIQIVELTLNVTDVALSVEPPHHIQLIADVQIWTSVCAAYVRAYSMGGLQRTIDRNKLFEHAQAMLAEARAALTVYEQHSMNGPGVGQYGVVPPSGMARLRPSQDIRYGSLADLLADTGWRWPHW